MQKTKKTLTGILAGMLSVMLAVVMAVGVAYIPNITASAAIVTIETVVEGKTWQGSWSSLEGHKQLELVVDETGFYNLYFEDHKQNGALAFDLNGPSYFYDYFIGGSEYSSENVFLQKGTYDFYIGYFDGSEDTSDSVPLDGNVSFVFNKSDYTPPVLPNCDVESSKLQIAIGDTADWFAFTTTQAGDYSFNYSNYSADLYLSVYSAKTGEWVDSGYSEVWLYEYETYLNRERIVFNLDANTTYYISVNGYEPGQSMKISMTKNEKTVKNIAAYESLIESYQSFWGVDYVSRLFFNYKITYTDGTTEIVDTFLNVLYAGYDLPYIEYAGGYSYANGIYFLHAGRQLVESTYDDVVTKTYITVPSVYDAWPDSGVLYEKENTRIEYESDDEYRYYWKVMVTEDGVYNLHSSSNFNTNFDYYEINILDKNNVAVKWDSVDKGWPLEAYQNYVLVFTYKYNSAYTWNDFVFYLRKDANIRNGWQYIDGRWFFYENGTALKNQWRQDSKGWVYLGADGAMRTNAWCQDSQGWCYVGADGYAVTNCWKRDSIGWIWLNANGSMTKNQWILDGGKWYYLDADGYMVCNQWKRDSIGWVYVGADGAMLTNSWCTDSQGWCYVGADGYAVTNCWKRDSYGWIWLNANGSMTKNQWIQDGGSWYYLDGNGYMVTGWQAIGGVWYNFNSNGVWIG